jgi:hypothetical protein
MALHIMAISSIDFAAGVPANIFVDGRNSRSELGKKGQWWLSRRSPAWLALLSHMQEPMLISKCQLPKVTLEKMLRLDVNVHAEGFFF